MDPLETREFYELSQQYRHARYDDEYHDERVIAAWEAMKKFIRAHYEIRAPAERLSKMAELKLGDKVRDIYSGFEGYVHGVCFYITGCNQILVNARKVIDGKPSGGEWLDDVRLELVESAAEVWKRRYTGGPTETEKRGLRNC